MKIKSLEFYGSSDAGEFSGKIQFQAGLNIISADNGFGKSLIVSGIGWCLGLEPMVALGGSNDNSIFSDAVRSKIEFDGNKNHIVKTSFASIEIEFREGVSAKFTRAIVGSDPKFVAAEINLNGKITSAKLIIGGQGTLSDETAGFQHHLFNLFGWPINKLVKYNGNQGPLYFENLGALFFIEQLGGWTDIQAQQVTKYQSIDVAAHAFEYMLKLDNHYEDRFQAHLGSTHAREMKRELSGVISEIDDILKEHGQHELLSTHGKIEDMYRRYKDFDLKDELRKRINWVFEVEKGAVQARIAALREQLDQIDGRDAPEGFKRATEEIAVIRAEYRDLDAKLVQLKIQTRDEQSIAESLKQKIDSARDLERFKSQGVGILRDQYHCPTCAQTVTLEGTQLYNLSPESLKRYGAATKRELSTIQNSISRTKSDIEKIEADKANALMAISRAESRFALLHNVVSQRKAEIIATVDQINNAERDLEKTIKFNNTVEDLRQKLKDTLARAQQLISKEEVEKNWDEEKSRLKKFLKLYRESIKQLDLSAFKKDPQSIDKIQLTEDYLPSLDGRLLRNFASASDQARIILPYVVSLAQIASTEGRHPGLLVLDEPLQQNPDEDRRPSMIKYFEELKSISNVQILIFTSLQQSEVIHLKLAGVSTMTWPKGRFLQLQESAP